MLVQVQALAWVWFILAWALDQAPVLVQVQAIWISLVLVQRAIPTVLAQDLVNGLTGSGLVWG